MDIAIKVLNYNIKTITTMFSESKVTEIYCLADDFCKEFAVQQEKYMIEDKSRPHRNKPNRMSDAEIMVILIFYPAHRNVFSPHPINDKPIGRIKYALS